MYYMYIMIWLFNVFSPAFLFQLPVHLFFYRLQMEIEMKFKIRRSIKDPLLVWNMYISYLLQTDILTLKFLAKF